MSNELPTKVSEVLTRDEIRELVTPTDHEGTLSVALTWTIIMGTLWIVGTWTNTWTIGMALVVLGGRHLALAILMHEASHRSLFKSRTLNDVIGKWLCAAPSWQQLHKYREHHLAHHAHTGTDNDPDLCLVEPFPTSWASLFRKFARDLTGLTAIKRIIGLLLMDMGFVTYTASGNARRIDQTGRSKRDILRMGLQNTGPVVLTNLALYGLLSTMGIGWTWWIWFAAYMTTFSLILRIRAIAEHACTDETDNQFLNTRSTRANWLARLTVAPHHVNYHLEHHLLMTVPHYRLPRMQQLLREKGVYEHAHWADGYWQVLKQVIRDQDQTPQPA